MGAAGRNNHTMFSEQAGDLVSNISHLADDGGGITKAKLTWKHFKSEGYEANNEM